MRLIKLVEMRAYMMMMVAALLCGISLTLAARSDPGPLLKPSHSSDAVLHSGAGRSLLDNSLDFRSLGWGLGTSSYQVEGGAHEGGRQPSVWDKFSMTPGKVVDFTTGNYSAYQYGFYKEDVEILKQLQAKYYRFSLSWSRLITNAGSPAHRTVNQEGLAYYNALISELIDNGIEPMVTLYHWDLPSNSYMDETFWLAEDSTRSTEEFVYYADVAFGAFGDRVKAWSTFNEPWTFSMLGYGWGGHAPGLQMPQAGPWRVGHNVLLAHAGAVQLFRTKYAYQKGRISINLNCDWAQPLTDSEADKQAAQWSTEFWLGWFADAVHFGDYPQSMRTLLGNRLPTFTDAQKELVKNSTDYFALNSYSSVWAFELNQSAITSTTMQFWNSTQNDPVKGLIGAESASSWLKVVPWGFRSLLNWIKDRYGNPDIWITEQGVSVPNEAAMTTQDAVNDDFRVAYYRGYLTAMCEAMYQDGVNVKGYIAWSLADNFEWARGYTERFGVVRVDLYNKPNVSRHVKKSAYFLADVFVHGNATKA